jgi:hypothetical protein
MNDINNNEVENEQLDENGNVAAIATFTGSVYSVNQLGKDLPLHQRNAFLRISIQILKEMTDFKLLRQNFGFLLITLSNFFVFSGYFPPFLYITKIAENNNIPNPAILLSIIGNNCYY